MAALKGVKTLDMVNGEITKVAYEDAEYERVEGEAKVGDLVLITDDSWCGAAEGAFYLSIGISEVDPWVVDDEGEKNSNYSGNYVLFRKKHVRLKVGDYAKVVGGSDSHILAEGDLVSISYDDCNERPFYCKCLTGGNSGGFQWLSESELVLATEAEVAAAKEAEAKRSIEAKWAKIGRKVDEYKKGDIVAYNGPSLFQNEGVGEVTVNTDREGDTRVEAVDCRGDRTRYYLSSGHLTLITPVEARFDRG